LGISTLYKGWDTGEKLSPSPNQQMLYFMIYATSGAPPSLNYYSSKIKKDLTTASCSSSYEGY